MIYSYQEAGDAAEDDGPDWWVETGLLADRDVVVDVSEIKNIHNCLKKLGRFTNTV